MNTGGVDESPTTDLRRQLDERRTARSEAVARLKAVAAQAAKGRKTPITDSFKEPAEESLSDSGTEYPSVTARIRANAKKTRMARTNELQMLKQTTMAAAFQVLQQTVRLGPPVEESGESLNGNGATPGTGAA
jgi:hypothetical protein